MSDARVRYAAGRLLFIRIALLRVNPNPAAGFSRSWTRRVPTGLVRSWKTWKSHGILKWSFPGLEKSWKKTSIIKVLEKSWKCC